MESWQKIDDEHAHCGECSGVFRNAQLIDGLCEECTPAIAAKATKVAKRSAERTTTRAMKASAQLLASIREQGKTGKSMPIVMDSFLKEVGGQAGYGAGLAREFKKAKGEGLSADELETFEYSPMVVLKWYELVNRSMLATDAGKDLDIGSLDESDLESIVANIGRKAVLEDPDIRRLALMNAIDNDQEFRAMAFDAILKADPGLETALLEKHGYLTITASQKKKPQSNKQVEDEDSNWDL